MSKKFTGKVALVTGATSGIGKEIARQLLAHGTKVVVNYGGNEEQAKETYDEFGRMFGAGGGLFVGQS